MQPDAASPAGAAPNVVESVVKIDGSGVALPAIASLPPGQSGELGVLVIVGGPQYRVGSHRQFVQLARHLAAEGFPTLRFDYRGMGDACGAATSFEAAGDDIVSAIDGLLRAAPSVRRVVLWGLCDAASAALMHGTAHVAVAGVVLVNPWVRSEATLATTTVKHYYRGRFLEREFWLKLATGRFDWRASLRSLGANLLAARRLPTGTESGGDFRDRMARGWAALRGPSLLILSGDDLTAREFVDYSVGQERWRRLLARPEVRRVDVHGADHTFSRRTWKAQVEHETSRWLHEVLCTR